MNKKQFALSLSPHPVSFFYFTIVFSLLIVHFVTINYPYFTEDEATYRMLGSLIYHQFIEAGLMWKVFFLMTKKLDASNYRYISAVELIPIVFSIFYIFKQCNLSHRGFIANIIFLASPIVFYVFHSTRPEPFHTAFLFCVVTATIMLIINNFKNKSITGLSYFCLVILMCCNLLLPHAHMFGIVHMPVSYFLIVLTILTLPCHFYVRILLIVIFSFAELFDIISFLHHSLPLSSVNLSFFEKIKWTMSIVDKSPASFMIKNITTQEANKVPSFLLHRFSAGRYLQTATAFLIWMGFIGAFSNFIRKVINHVYDGSFILSICIIIFYLTFFSAVFKSGYFNLAYIATIIPWAAMGCALAYIKPHSSISSTITADKKINLNAFFIIINNIISIGVIIIIITLGIGQIYLFSMPLRSTSFSDNVTAIKLALLENACTDVPYISAPYQGFISAQPQHEMMQFAPDFIVTYTTNLKYMLGAHELRESFNGLYDSTIDRLNSPHACIVASQHQLLALGTFGSYTNISAVKFFMDNFKIVKSIKTSFYYNDNFEYENFYKFNHNVRMGEPLIHHGSVEEIYILKSKNIITKSLIDKYSHSIVV